MYDLSQILLKRASKNELHHLYLLQNPWNETRENFNQKLENLLVKMHETLTGKTTTREKLANIEDILFLQKNEENAQFLMEDFDPFFQYIQYRSRLYPRRFVVIYDADRLSSLLVNKLLKVLEEPPVEMTIFLLNPSNKKLLATLESRSVKLKWGTPQVEKHAAELPKITHVQEFLEEIKGDREHFENLMTSLMNHVAQHPQSYTKHEQLIQLVKQYELGRTFHNSSYEIALNFLSLLTESA